MMKSDIQDNEVNNSDRQGVSVENDLCGNLAKESIVKELDNQKLPKIRETSVEISYRTILKKRQTRQEVTSLYKTLENFQTRLQISQRHGKVAAMSKVPTYKQKNITKQRDLYSTKKTKKRICCDYKEVIVT